MAESVSPVSGLIYVKSGSTNTGSTNVDTATFLKLLTSQMQYQDPLDPQSNTDFVAQLALMTELEQMQSMNGSLSTSKAMNYVGKEIFASILDKDTGATRQYSGVVSGVVMKDGEAYAIVGNNAIRVDDITSVVESTPKTDGTSEDESSDTGDSKENTDTAASAE